MVRFETPPRSFAQTWAEESEAIAKGRTAAGIAADADSVGLALSGGGIRSATFCLGALQALAQARRLVAIDYLSTVSGGGYVGAWLSAWIYRRGLLGPDGVAAQLGKQTDGGDQVEPPEVTWLRRYSNYLSPRIGLLSADSMTLVATWIRNVYLNLVVVVTLLALLVLLPRLLLEPTMFAMQHRREELRFAAAWLAFFLFPLAISFNLWRGMVHRRDPEVIWMNTTGGVFAAVIVPGMLTTVLASVALFDPVLQRPYGASSLLVGAAALLAAAGLSWLVYRLVSDGLSRDVVGEAFVFALAYGGALASGFALVGYFVEAIRPAGKTSVESAALVLSFGPPALLLTFGVSGAVIVGLVGRVYEERTREWWGRMNAWFLTLGLAWLAWFTLAFYMPALSRWAQAHSGDWAAAIAGAGWLGSLLTSLLVPRPEARRSMGSRWGALALDFVAAVAVVGFFVAVAVLVGWVLSALAGQPATPVAEPRALRDFVVAQFADLERVTTAELDVAPLGGVILAIDTTLVLALAVLLVFGVFGWRVDINRFSLHDLYKNRLIRCYLGASRQEHRRPHPFTGFDEDDDLALEKLQHSGVRRRTDTEPVVRPLHLINTTLNLTHGENLAWQERKAASFTLSPFYCGYALGNGAGEAFASRAISPDAPRGEGYRPSASWSSKGNGGRRFSIGMAMATSGAALSTNRGRSTTAAMAFLSTIFNMRLGRWAPNPRARDWESSGPGFAPINLLLELFGYSNEARKFVHLSDGGHFDNTGVYELVRRRCRTIIAVDATADPYRQFEDLANLVRKCRVDFGVRIEIPMEGFQTPSRGRKTCRGHVFGQIHYGHGSPPAHFILLKPTRLARSDLPVDVQSYAAYNASFPHQTTVDQFFDESQFESYRALGERIMELCLQDAALPAFQGSADQAEPRHG